MYRASKTATKLGRPREVCEPAQPGRCCPQVPEDADGAPLAEIANQLGHSDVNTTAGYLGRRRVPTRAASAMTHGPEERGHGDVQTALRDDGDRWRDAHMSHCGHGDGAGSGDVHGPQGGAPPGPAPSTLKYWL